MDGIEAVMKSFDEFQRPGYTPLLCLPQDPILQIEGFSNLFFASSSDLRADREAFGTPKEREKYVLSNKIWTFFLRPLWGGQKAKKEQF